MEQVAEGVVDRPNDYGGDRVVSLLILIRGHLENDEEVW